MSEFNQFWLPYTTSKGETGRFNCTSEDTELYLHKSQYEFVDHIFHRFDERDRRLGAFVWRHVLGEQFGVVANSMTTSGNWPVFYRPEPTDSDLEAYTQEIGREVDKFLEDPDL